MATLTLELTRLEALKVRRERLGWTQEKLAEKAGYSPIYGSHVQRGITDSEQALSAMEAALTLGERDERRRPVSEARAQTEEATS